MSAVVSCPTDNLTSQSSLGLLKSKINTGKKTTVDYCDVCEFCGGVGGTVVVVIIYIIYIKNQATNFHTKSR